MHAIKDWGQQYARFYSSCAVWARTALKRCRDLSPQNKGDPFQEGTATSTGQYSFSEPAHGVWPGRADPRAARPFMRGPEAKQCSFKPHAVKVVYLLVTRDVTTHPCLRAWTPV